MLTGFHHELQRVLQGPLIHRFCHLFDEIAPMVQILVLDLLHIDVEMIVKRLLFHLVFRDKRTASLLDALEVASIRHLDVRLIVLLAVVVGAAPKLALFDLAAARENRLCLAHKIINPASKRR